MESLHRSLARSGFIRLADGRILGGVCSGLGVRLGVDPWALRVVFLLSLVVIPGSQLLIYPLAWLLMPDQQRAASVLAQLSSPVQNEAKAAV